MEYEFSFRQNIGGHDIDGVALLVEAGTDADGYVPFRVEAIQFNHHTTSSRPSLASFKLEAAIREWVREQIEADDDAQAAWDDFVGNEGESYAQAVRQHSTLHVRNGAVA